MSKFSELTRQMVQVEPLLVRPETAELMLGSPELLQEMLRAKWLAPLVQRHRMTLYTLKSITGCAARLERGELPESSMSSSAGNK